MFYLGAIFVFGLITIMSIVSGRRTGKGANYGEGKYLSAPLVTGALIGTLVGGSSTIGTAQLAFSNGFSAWWFTLGGGIGIILLALVFLKKVYFRKETTLPSILSSEYGARTGLFAAVLSSLGTFLSFIAQILSGTSLIMAVTDFGYYHCIIIIAVLMIIYVYYGGTLALGYGGLVKTILLSASVIICGTLVLRNPETILKSNDLQHSIYFNLLGRGPYVDLGAGLSLIIGVLTTQSYFNAVLSARSYKDARSGCLLTALIVPLIGIFCIYVGLYMKVSYPEIDSRLALPAFILLKMNPLIAGMMLATLLIAVIGTGAGLSFGMASMIYRNIIVLRDNQRMFTDSDEKRIIRLILLAIIFVGCLICSLNLGQIILKWSFLSMGLRGAVSFMPLIGALFFPQKFNSKNVILSMFAGIIFTVFGFFILPSTIDPLFLGILASAIVMMMGIKKKGIAK